ncbi:MAG: hypothetical protein HC908_10580 [Calothrix sp. SM1_7_51]|nr:hypothetical protein [Calothrix sp. SM1_7_51]
MEFKCPFYHDNADGKPTANAPCKFQQNPYREHVMFCTVCGQSRDLRLVGWRPNILLVLIVLGVVIFLVTQEENSGRGKKPNNTPKNNVEQIRGK